MSYCLTVLETNKAQRCARLLLNFLVVNLRRNSSQVKLGRVEHDMDSSQLAFALPIKKSPTVSLVATATFATTGAPPKILKILTLKIS